MFSKIKEDKAISRRELVVGAGKLMAGAASIAVLLNPSVRAEAAKKKTSELPWPYKKLNEKEIKKAAEIAHENWFKGFCCYATLSGIIEVLREKIGEPYTSFPLEAIIFAHGGTSGWGATCGTLIGSGIASSLVTGPKTGEAINNEVINYYAYTALPVYIPDHPRVDIRTKSTSNSPVCHISVGKWMKGEGVGFLSPQQMERCSRLSADMAMKTIEFLNAWADGKFVATNKAPVFTNELPSQNNCTDCHGSEVPKTSGKFGTGLDLLKSGH